MYSLVVGCLAGLLGEGEYILATQMVRVEFIGGPADGSKQYYPVSDATAQAPVTVGYANSIRDPKTQYHLIEQTMGEDGIPLWRYRAGEREVKATETTLTPDAVVVKGQDTP